MKTVVVTSATGEPVTLSDLKDHLRVDSTYDNDLLTALITAARRRTENIIGNKIMPQKWTVYFDQWPMDDYMEMPYFPLRSIDSTGVVYTNSTGNSTTMSSSDFSADIASKPGRLVLDYNSDWPTETLSNNNPIAVTFNCGYESTAKVPEDIKLAIKLIAGHYYENREDTYDYKNASQKMENIPQASKFLLQEYRNWRF